MLSRRDLIGAASLALIAPWSSSALAQTPRRRRNVAAMGPGDPDLVALRTGIAAMRSRSDQLSYEHQRQIHEIYVRQHGTWRFLPWHRAQLHAFEQIVATLSGKSDFALPYWDWQQIPNIPPIFFTDRRFG